MRKTPQSKLLLQKLRLTAVSHSLYIEIYNLINLSMNGNDDDNVNNDIDDVNNNDDND